MTKRCIGCSKISPLISSPLNLCIDCLRLEYNRFEEHINRIHAESRERFSLPSKPPRDENGILCNLCIHRCLIPENERGYCGIRKNRGGKLKDFVSLDWYFDSLPTNCVADWVCPAGNEAGYPKYSHQRGPEYGLKNISVFYRACSFNCLFCQNWHFKQYSSKGMEKTQSLIQSIDEKTSCICFFGGDPTPFLPHAIELSKRVIKQKGGILRICFETNGTMNEEMLRRIADISLQSGGCIKFDLKAYNENLHKALCGVSNQQTLKNFMSQKRLFEERPDPPFLVASTLLIPGYIDVKEVSQIASFIASVHPDIPYTLLGFFPHFYMKDLPLTSKELAYECLEEAKRAGLKRVRIGNPHLLRE